MKKRLEILDSFRFIAIMLVVLLHYFSSKKGMNIYPYGDRYADIFLFRYGYMGVELFFIISGFVIFMTIEKCLNFEAFILKRVIRLWPALTITSIIVFLVARLLDHSNQFPYISKSAFSFLPSLTFIDPWAWSQILHEKIFFMDGVYWSLLVEMKFYIIFGILFFINKKNILVVWLFFNALILMSHVLDPIHHNRVTDFLVRYDDMMKFGKYLIYFTIGMLMYCLYEKRKLPVYIYISSICLFVLHCYLFLEFNEIIIACFFIFLFLLFVFKPMSLSCLKKRWIATIGVFSYPLYLLHNIIGCLIINKVAKAMSLSDTFSTLLAISVIILLITVSYLYNKFVDIPIQKFLKIRLLTKPPDKFKS